MLEKRLEDESLTPPEKARIMTQLAALSRAAGVEPAAERRLLEALGCVPDHIPAIIALADFYADAERWTDLEAFLREVLDGDDCSRRAPGRARRRSAPPAGERAREARPRRGCVPDAGRRRSPAPRPPADQARARREPLQGAALARGRAPPLAAREPRGCGALSDRGRAGPLPRGARRDPQPAPREGARRCTRARSSSSRTTRPRCRRSPRSRWSKATTRRPPIC